MLTLYNKTPEKENTIKFTHFPILNVRNKYLDPEREGLLYPQNTLMHPKICPTGRDIHPKEKLKRNLLKPFST